MVDSSNSSEKLKRLSVQPDSVQDGQVREKAKDDPKLGQLLVKQGLITKEDLAKALAQQKGLSYVDMGTMQIQPEALKLISEPVARKYKVMPIAIFSNSLQVAMADANDVFLLEALYAHTKMRIEPLIAIPEDIQKAIDRNYRSHSEIEKQFTETPEQVIAASARETAARLQDSASDAPVVRALDLIIEEAIKNRASDIHIEPEAEGLRLRLRIDGVLHELLNLPISAHASLISRLKIISNMNIADHRPQDGQFSVKIRGKEIDIRVATVTTAYGEMATLRVLDKSFAVLGLNEIGFLPDNLKLYEQMLRHPFGMILVSGPTGSGKTTTLYASINSLDRKGRNIITIEDPVEYHLKGINQIQVHPRAGLTFSAGLRAVMRHDPNVILVGEIRDTDTASTAIQAALTGHLVLASVHANDAVGVLFRLLDLGVEPFLVAASLVGVLAQRMVRRVCTQCQHLAPAPVAAQAAYCKELHEERKEFVYGKGCNTCANTGYRSRVAVFEIMRLSDELRRRLLTGASAAQLREQAKEEGMTSIWHDAMLKVKAGITTPDEVLRSIPPES